MMRTIAKLLLVSMVGLIGVGATTAASPLARTQKLGILNDSGTHWVLQNSADYKMKWTVRDSNPYQHYELYAGPGGLVYVQTTDELKAIQPATGNAVWKHPSLWDSELDPVIGSDGAFYKVAYAKMDHAIYVTQVTRFNSDGTLSVYKLGDRLTSAEVDAQGQFRLRAAGDTQGHFVLATNQGLVSLNPDGSTNWTLGKVSTDSGEIDLTAVDDLFADGQDRLYVRLGGTMLALNLDGSLLWARDYGLQDLRNTYLVTKDGYLLQSTSSNDYGAYPVRLYEMAETGLKAVYQPSIIASQMANQDGRGGIYRVNETQEMVTDSWLSTGAFQWTYQLGKMERASGQGLRADTMRTDAKGNVYVGSNVGNVYALDNLGKPRFIIAVNNAQQSYPDILPVSDSLTLIAVNNRLVAIEKVAKKS